MLLERKEYTHQDTEISLYQSRILALCTLYNGLGCAASRLIFVYKYLAVLFLVNNACLSEIRYCRLLIAPINYKCINHCNTFDEVSTNIKNNLQSDLQCIVDDVDKTEDMGVEAMNTIEFIRSWGVVVPTTCCYKFVFSRISFFLKQKSFIFLSNWVRYLLSH